MKGTPPVVTRKSGKPIKTIDGNNSSILVNRIGSRSTLRESVEKGNLSIKRMGMKKFSLPSSEPIIRFVNQGKRTAQCQLLNELVDPWNHIDPVLENEQSSPGVTSLMVADFNKTTKAATDKRNVKLINVAQPQPYPLLKILPEKTLSIVVDEHTPIGSIGTPSRNSFRGSASTRKSSKKSNFAENMLKTTTNIKTSAPSSPERRKPISRHNSDKNLTQRLNKKNEEVAMKQFMDILILKEHNKKLKKKMKKIQPDLVRLSQFVKKKKIKPSIITSQKPEITTSGVNLRICPKLSSYFRKDLSKDNINKYFSLRDKGTPQQLAIIQANKFIEVPVINKKKKANNDNLKLGAKSQTYINQLKERGLKDCFENYCEKSKFDRDNIISFYHAAEQNLAAGLKKSKSVAKSSRDSQLIKARTPAYTKIGERNKNLPVLQIDPSSFTPKYTCKSLSRLPKFLYNIEKNRESPTFSKFQKSEDKRNFETFQSDDIYINQRERENQKLDKAQNRKEKYLEEKSKRFKINHHIVLEKVRNAEEIEYTLNNQKYLEKYFPERLDIENMHVDKSISINK